jgi:hypothetical protein
MTNLEMDGIKSILMIISKIISRQATWVCCTTRKKSTTTQQFEADPIHLMTMRHIKLVLTNSNKRSFSIECVMDQYEESNATIQARHSKLFKNDTYIFDARKELVMCMPFDFINGLKDKKWTHIDKKWLVKLMKHLKKAQSSNIKQIRFIKHIGRLHIYKHLREYKSKDDCYIYEIFLENDTSQ